MLKKQVVNGAIDLQHILNKSSRVTLFQGNPAISKRPAAFRPCLATGMALSK